MPSFDLVINNKYYNIETESTDKCRYICKIKPNEHNNIIKSGIIWCK